MRLINVVLAVCLSTACDAPPPETTPDKPARARGEAPPAPDKDSARATPEPIPGPRLVVVSEPTLIVATSSTQAEVDSGDAGEAIADLSYYLSLVGDSLRRLGVTQEEVNAETLSVRVDNTTYRWVLLGDSSIAYVFAQPGHQPSIRYGVLVDSEILEWIHQELRGQRARPE